MALIFAGGFLLWLPISSSRGTFTPLDISFFTATSAATVTGHSIVNTSIYWSYFGQAIIFILMLVGGLGFMVVATFILGYLHHRSSLSERLVLVATMGLERMGGLRELARRIVMAACLIYLIGAVAIFWCIRGTDGASIWKTIWQSLFLSVAAFNNAGFSILPEWPPGTGMARYASQELLLFILMALIILGGIGWTTLVDIWRNRHFSRLALDTKLVIVASCLLWAIGAAVMFLAEHANAATLGNLTLMEQLVNSIFHSVSARTTGLQTIDFGDAAEFTKLTYPSLMFIGGGAASVAGGIKVNVLALVVAAVISTLRARQYTEAFGREIAFRQVLRALAVGTLSATLIILVMPILTLTEPDLDFLDLYFDTVSAFGTVGLSTGVAADLSLWGKIILMITMLIGRLGPLTLALALAPRKQPDYHYIREPVSIG